MSLYISNRLVRIFLNDALTLWINPEKIQFYVGSSRPKMSTIEQTYTKPRSKNALAKLARRQTRRVTNAFESFVLQPDYYQETTPIEEHRNYRKISDIIDHRDNYQESEWYLDLLQSLKENGFAKHKSIMMRSENDIDRFMRSYVLSLLDSLEKDGFDLKKGGGIGRALIGKDGSIHKSGSGRHRLFAARELGIGPIPVRISGVHEEWYRDHVGSRFNRRKLKMALSDVQENHA